jgi:Flp pilus assembly secretin CpaC
MNPSFNSPQGWHLVAMLGLEVTAMALLAWTVQRFFNTAAWRRLIWQSALLGLTGLLLAQFSGMHRFVNGLIFSRPQQTALGRKIIVTPGSLSAMPLDTLANPQLEAEPPPVPLPPTSRLLPTHETFWWPVWIWLAGTILGMGRIVSGQCLLAWTSARRRHLADSEMQERLGNLAGRLGMKRRVRLIEDDRLTGPVAFGLFRPAIGLPSKFSQRYTAPQREAMLAHELAHLAAFDPLWYGLANLLTAVLWWHPAVWWMRRQFHRASELAADEASLVVERGPVALAECLVALGRQLSRRRSVGWLGVEGQEFRSGLGRRVARLFQLDASARKPIGSAAGILVNSAASLGLMLTAVVGGGCVENREGPPATFKASWNGSYMGMTLNSMVGDSNPPIAGPSAAATDEKPVDPENPPTPNVQNKIEAVPTQAPAVPAGDAVGAPSSPKLTPTDSNADRTTTAVESTKERNRILSLLETLKIPEIDFDGIPLAEVARILTEKTRALDPDKRGIEFKVRITQGFRHEVDPATGLPIPGDYLQGLLIWISPAPLKEASLKTVLDAVVAGASRFIEYSLKDGAIVFSDQDLDRPPLFTRWFKVDPNSFSKSLRETKIISGVKGQPNDGAGPTATHDTNVIDEIRRFLGSLGVDLAPPKAIFYNDRLGMLMARTTRHDLDLIEQAVQMLNMSPPQVTIEVKFAEITQDDTRALGFDWLLGQGKAGISGTTAPSNGSKPFDPTTSPAASPSTTNNQVANGLRNSTPAATKLTGILTDPQFKMIVHALEQRQGVDLLSAPKVTTLSGRPAQIKVVSVRYVVDVVTNLDVAHAAPPSGKLAEEGKRPQTSPDSTSSKQTIQPVAKPVELGPVLDIVPYVAADGYSIQMTVVATIVEFEGYDKQAAALFSSQARLVAGSDASTPLTSVSALPIFRRRQVVGSAVVKDGQTLVMSGGSVVEEVIVKDKVPVLGDLPLAGRLFRSEKKQSVRKQLLVFVTPTLIDPAGNRVHTKEDAASPRKALPDQTQPQAQSRP